ncbi:MAG TPA: S-methyl-5'-thioadenosine phosphorylase [bacterium]|jgi:5'-methylthioadenosine phosphorylase
MSFPKPEIKAEIGIFGGSGFYSLLDKADSFWVETPYGHPSDKVTVGKIKGRSVAFLPRHGSDHRYPPHQINYRANVWAMKALGVENLLGPCASGSLQADVAPGDFVICDQFVDRTKGRIDTFYDGPVTTHLAMAEPYCPVLRKIAIEAGRKLKIVTHETGTVVVIQGPRFSTVAESKWFSSMGWEVINMTQYPEAYLARELGMSYAMVALITDYDVGLEGHPDVKPVTHEEVVKVFLANNDKLKGLLYEMIPNIPKKASKICRDALKGARFG